jgi:hypothetical protein
VSRDTGPESLRLCPPWRTSDDLAGVTNVTGDEPTNTATVTTTETTTTERQAELLKPKAAERKGGRPSKETGSKLEQVSQGKTRILAAAGTGYSGSTLDKVDKIRDVAERGVTNEVAAPTRGNLARGSHRVGAAVLPSLKQIPPCEKTLAP